MGPLLAGLFAGDVDRLSVRATFPELEAWERSQGSLIRGSQAASRNARRAGPLPPMFVRPRGGVDRLAEVLADELGERVRTSTPATAIARDGAGWRVEVDGAAPIAADAVVLATSSPVASRLLADEARRLGARARRDPVRLDRA